MIEAEKILNSGLTEMNLNIDVFPVVAPENTNLPYIVYEVENDYQSTKFGIYGNMANGSIFIYTDKYISGVNIRSLIANYFNSNSEFEIAGDSIKINIVNDDTKYTGDCYLSTMNYQILIN